MSAVPVLPEPPRRIDSGPVVPPHAPRPYPLPVVESPRVAALAAAPTPEAVAAFWAEVTAAGTPLVEPDGDAYVVTFLWRDGSTPDGSIPDGSPQDAPTRDVVLHANKLTDYNDLRQSLLRRVPGTNVWHLSYRLPGGWRASYGLGPLPTPVRPPDPTTGPDRAYWRWLQTHLVTDPLNRHPLPNKPGEPDLSVVSLPGAPEQPWLARRDGVAAGSLTEHRVASFTLGNERTVWVYTPPGAGHRDLPVLVLFDGEVWGGEGALGHTLDNLIAAGRIPPLVALLVDSVDVPTRVRELACAPSFVEFLTAELLPWAGGRWPVTDDPARTLVAGQSLGGLAAAFCGLLAPERFGAVLSQSGSYWYPGGRPQDATENWLAGRYVVAPRLPLRWYLEVGRREWELLGPTRHLRDVLLAKGYPVTYQEYDGGHDIACWRGGLADGLIALFGGGRADR